MYGLESGGKLNVIYIQIIKKKEEENKKKGNVSLMPYISYIIYLLFYISYIACMTTSIYNIILMQYLYICIILYMDTHLQPYVYFII